MSSAKGEFEALWRAVFREPPAIDAEPRLLAELIIKCSPPPPFYGAAEIKARRRVIRPDGRSVPCGQ